MLWCGADERPVKISRSGTQGFRICGEKNRVIQNQSTFNDIMSYF